MIQYSGSNGKKLGRYAKCNFNCAALDVRILAATDLSLKTGCDSSTARLMAIDVNVRNVSLKMTIINGCPVSQKVWHSKEPSLLKGHECRAQVKICSLSSVTFTSPHERKIQNKQINKQTRYMLFRKPMDHYVYTFFF